jgi:plasmid replication initiation protein
VPTIPRSLRELRLSEPSLNPTREPSQACFVKCDSTTTTQADIDRDVVKIVIGFADHAGRVRDHHDRAACALR